MKIAVCDDEKREADTLQTFLKAYFKDVCKVDVFYSGRELLESKIRYDIFFLDIELEDASGIAIAEAIREKDLQTYLVFVTNYEDFYRRAFTVHAFEYLVKPICREQVFKLLDELMAYMAKDRQSRELYFKGVRELVKVPVNQICYFEFESRKIKMVLDKDIIWLNGTIKGIADSMKQYDFVVPHKAFVVNMRKIKELKRYDIVMSNGDVVPIAQKRAAAFRESFEVYLYDQV